MPYILNKTNGAVLTTLGDASIDRTTDLTFVGKNYAGYGEIINEDLLRLLENFSSASAPARPLSGQLWYDTKSKKLKLYNGAKFKELPINEISPVSPKDQGIGDFWFNSTEKKLYVKSSDTGYTFIGPSNLINYAALVTIRDTNNELHKVITLTVYNTVVAIQSNEDFIINSSEILSNQFTNIKRGLNMATDYAISTTQLTTGDVTTHGTITGQWGLVNGSTLTATYADLAERYASDAVYEPGTVLVIGGDMEVTTTNQYADITVAGVVSTKPAFKLNSEAGTDSTHPYIALKGRVPCKVIGPVKKGNLLVTSSTPGYAQATIGRLESANAIIGKALEDFQGGMGVIEIKV